MTQHMLFDKTNKCWVLEKSERGVHIKKTRNRVVFSSSKEGKRLKQKVPFKQPPKRSSVKRSSVTKSCMRKILMKKMTVVTLQNMCVDLYESKTGNKDDLIDKLKDNVKDLNKFGKDTLQHMCEDLELVKSGNKVDIIKRLAEV